ncbi:hypothetical protein QYE76_013289 [Lolium multiflorum]|uniref:Uncharacterized protein n=1 Tax=Lolium multiflorum TaxID=4521 RepID=A0AAD8U0U2_LOLMU|nr:hypothetical protein QYE76_013289 [Lolium multiflorum]
MADNFVMIEGESPEDMYRCLTALAVQMKDLGETFVDDHWIKRKFYNALLPYEEVKLTAIRQNYSFHAMTSDEREDNGGRLVRKDKSKTFSKGFSKFSSKPGENKVSFTKKPKAFIIHEKYSSNEGGEHDDKSSNKEDEGVATIAISTPSNSLFDSPNENLITNNSRCLMAKRQYSMDLLQRASMTDFHSSPTPVDTSSKLSATDGEPLTDVTNYRTIVGALQYLTLTRPDISHAIQQICLHMHAPRTSHLALVKHVLRYIRGTLEFCLQLHASSSTALTAYSYAD